MIDTKYTCTNCGEKHEMLEPCPDELPRPDLTDEELTERCEEWITKLCKSGGRAWTLRVPVDLNRDPDMLFCELIRRFKEK